MSFANQVVIITGASSGIGHALARALAGQGVRLGLLARRQELLEQLAGEIRQAGGTAAVVPADVSERAQLKAAIAELRQQLGPIDLLIANAGVGVTTHLDQSNIDDVERMVRVNLLGVIYSIEAVLPEMLQRGKGHLAAVSSLGAYKGLPGESGYCCTKAAVNVYLEGLRIQLQPLGIHVTCICPGFVQTPMTAIHQFEMPFLMSAEEAAHHILIGLRRRVGVLNFPWPMTLLLKASRWAPDWVVRRFMSNHMGPGFGWGIDLPREGGS
jgi:short-subunit dehydrogenase